MDQVKVKEHRETKEIDILLVEDNLGDVRFPIAALCRTPVRSSQRKKFFKAETARARLDAAAPSAARAASQLRKSASFALPRSASRIACPQCDAKNDRKAATSP